MPCLCKLLSNWFCVSRCLPFDSQLSHLATTGIWVLEVVGPRVADRVVVTTAVRARVSGPVGVELSVVKTAVSTLRNTVLVDVESVEHVARSVRVKACVDGLSSVVDGSGVGVGSAERWVEWTREELGSEPVVATVNSLAGAVAWSSVTGLDSWSGVVGLVVSVGTGDDDVEVLSPATGVDSGGVVNVRSPKSTLVVGDGRWVWAPVTPDGSIGGVVLAWVLRWVALNVDVEGSAGGSVVTLSSAGRRVVRLESPETQVRVGRSRSVHVVESASVAGRSDSTESHGLEWSVIHEGVDGHVGWSVTIWLRSARVLRVDEATVSTSFRGGWASSGGARSG